MKFTKVESTHRVFDNVKYLGRGIVENAVEMTTGYRGKGESNLHKIIPASSEVYFTLEGYLQNSEAPFVILTIYKTKPDGSCGEYFHNYKWNNKTLEDVVSMLNFAIA